MTTIKSFLFYSKKGQVDKSKREKKKNKRKEKEMMKIVLGEM